MCWFASIFTYTAIRNQLVTKLKVSSITNKRSENSPNEYN